MKHYFIFDATFRHKFLSLRTQNNRKRNQDETYIIYRSGIASIYFDKQRTKYA